MKLKPRIKRISLLALLGLLLLSGLTALLPARTVLADTVTAVWTAKNKIAIGQKVFVQSVTSTMPGDNSGKKYVTFDLQLDSRTSETCPDIVYIDSSTIDTTKTATEVIESAQYFQGQQNTPCRPTSTNSVNIKNTRPSNTSAACAPDDTTCIDNQNKAASTAEGGGNQPTNSVECGDDTNSSLAWIICPVFDTVQAAADALNSMITQLLRINTGQIFSGDSGAAYKSAWSAIRNIALLFIVIAGLIMVIAQAVGSQAIDAYTVRSVLPRLLIAAIAIALSWILLQFLVDLTNALGEGVRTLIYAPFSGLNSSTHSVNGVAFTGGAILDGVGAIAAIGAGLLFAVNLGVLLSLAASLAIGLLVGFVVVVLRQLLVVFLIILAPIAIAAYCLPNTKKLFSTWWDWLFRALLMFPIIIAFIAVGRVFALVSLTQTNGNGGNDVLYAIVALVAYVVPFFMLPFTFKMAGGAMGGIAQGIHGLAAKPRSMLKKRAGQEAAKTFHMARNYGRFSDRNKLTKALNTAAGATSNPWRDLRRGRAGIKAGKQTGRGILGSEAFENNPIAKQNAQNDAFLIAASHMGIAKSKLGLAQSNYDDAVEKYGADSDEASKYAAEVRSRQRGIELAESIDERTRKSSSFRQAAALQLAATGYQISSGEAGYKELTEIASSVTGGDKLAMSHLMNDMQFREKQAQRYDLAGINDGAGYDASVGVGKASLYELGNGKKQSIQAMAETAGMTRIKNPASGKEEWATSTYATLGDDAKLKLGIHYKELEAMKPNTKGANRDEIIAQMEAMEASGIKEVLRSDSGKGSKPAPSTVQAYNPTRGATDDAYEALFTEQDKVRGYRTVATGGTTTQTWDELAQARARAYERLDPNRMT